MTDYDKLIRKIAVYLCEDVVDEGPFANELPLVQEIYLDQAQQLVRIIITHG